MYVDGILWALLMFITWGIWGMACNLILEVRIPVAEFRSKPALNQSLVDGKKYTLW